MNGKPAPEDIRRFMEDIDRFGEYDIVYCSEGLSQEQIKYIDIRPEVMKSFTRKEYEAFYESILPYNRYENSKMKDKGIDNLVPLI